MPNVKEKLLDCARDIFLDGGYRSFSMRKVASCAGVSAAAIYRHYESRENLLEAVFLKGFRLFTARLEGVNQSDSPRARLEAMGSAYFDFAVTERPYYELMFMSTNLLTGLQHIPEKSRKETRRSFVLVQKCIEEYIQEGNILTPDTYQAALHVWAFCHGLVSLYFTCKIDMNKEQFEVLYQQMLEGLFVKM